MAIEGRHRRNDFDLISTDGTHSFLVFLRQSTEFPENFSIGLDYTSSPDGNRICLLRCNGPHGEALRLPRTPEHHFRCHIHLATEEAMISGQRAESFAVISEEFSTFEEAFVYFAGRCNIMEAERLFSFVKPEQDRQLGLFGDSND